TRLQVERAYHLAGFLPFFAYRRLKNLRPMGGILECMIGSLRRLGTRGRKHRQHQQRFQQSKEICSTNAAHHIDALDHPRETASSLPDRLRVYPPNEKLHPTCPIAGIADRLKPTIVFGLAELEEMGKIQQRALRDLAKGRNP